MKSQKGFMLVHFTRKSVNLDLWASTKEELQDTLASLISEKKDAKILPLFKENNKSYLQMPTGELILIG